MQAGVRFLVAHRHGAAIGHATPARIRRAAMTSPKIKLTGEFLRPGQYAALP